MSEARGLLGLGQAAQIGSIAANPPSLTERLEAERQHLSDRLTEIDVVLARLKANPEIQDLFDAVTRLGHLHY